MVIPVPGDAGAPEAVIEAGSWYANSYTIGYALLPPLRILRYNDSPA